MKNFDRNTGFFKNTAYDKYDVNKLKQEIASMSERLEKLKQEKEELSKDLLSKDQINEESLWKNTFETDKEITILENKIEKNYDIISLNGNPDRLELVKIVDKITEDSILPLYNKNQIVFNKLPKIATHLPDFNEKDLRRFFYSKDLGVLNKYLDNSYQISLMFENYDNIILYEDTNNKSSNVALIDLSNIIALHPKMSLFDFDRLGFYKVDNCNLSEKDFNEEISLDDLYAQRTNDAFIGKVDYFALIMLHPSMMDYNPEIKAFAIKRDDYSLQKMKIEKRENSDDIIKLQKRIKALQARVVEEDKKFLDKMDKIKKKHLDELVDLATGPAAVSEIEYQNEVDKEDERHISKIYQLNGEITILEEELQKINHYVYSKDYTTPNETDKRIDTIIAEVNTYIKHIANQRGISIVLNSGYRRFYKKIDFSASRDDYVSSPMTFGSIFVLNYEEGDYALKGYYESVNSRVNSWLYEAGDILKKKTNYLVNCDVVLGGIDLTADVLNNLYKAYKIDQNVTNAIIQSLVSNN